MLTLQRHEEILSILKEERSVTVLELSERLFASGSTIRRDLQELEKLGVIRRSHGGAVLLESRDDEFSSLVREQQNPKQKKEIAGLTAKLLRDNCAFFLDSSSTVGAVIPHISGFRDVVAVTNGLKNALILSEYPRIRTVIACGSVNAYSNSVVGSDTLAWLSEIHTDFCITSCSGIDLVTGMTESTFEQAQIKRQMLKNAKTRILLCDSSKFQKTYLCRYGDFGSIHYLVTDKKPPQGYLQAAKEAGCQVIWQEEK